MDHRTHRAAQRIEGRPAAPGIALGPLVRLAPVKHDARQRRSNEYGREERGVLQQHSDMGWLVGIQAAPECSGDRGTLPDMVTPAGEGVLEVHAASVDLD